MTPCALPTTAELIKDPDLKFKSSFAHTAHSLRLLISVGEETAPWWRRPHRLVDWVRCPQEFSSSSQVQLASSRNPEPFLCLYSAVPMQCGIAKWACNVNEDRWKFWYSKASLRIFNPQFMWITILSYPYSHNNHNILL